MRRIYYILFFLCLYEIIQAQEYQMAEIEHIAYSFFNQNPQHIIGTDSSQSQTIKQIASIEPISRDSKDYMYIVNTEGSNGWVILSNEKAYPTIIAHGDSGTFTYDEEILPPALLCILENHINAIDSTRNNTSKSATANYDTQTSTLLYTTKNLIGDDMWKQFCNNGLSQNPNKTYNKYSPDIATCRDMCGKVPVGCGPVAMAKIMRYWQWPDHATIGGVHNVTYHYDWDNMPTSINDNTDMYLVDAVAHLFRSCGQAATTAYTCSGSATVATEIHDAMREVFGYHSNLVYDWEDVDISSMLVGEINRGRPVIVQAHKATIFQGHSFVVDGYRLFNGNIQFHIHWGWGEDYAYSSTLHYCNLTFNGFKNGQIFLVELYPNCNLRANNISLGSSINIAANNNRTYFSTNDVILCSNNNSITIDKGGHLLVKAGNKVHIKKGFYAKAGSDVHIMINDTLCNSPHRASAPYKITQEISQIPANKTVNNTGSNNETDILSISIYTSSGQLLRRSQGADIDLSLLPNGFYVVQKYMTDGRVVSETIVKN